MKMIELTNEKFTEFAKDFDNYDYQHTEEYAKTMQNFGFDYKFIGYTTNDNEILAETLVLTKNISKNEKYAYCPKGYIIDYDNKDLLKKFTNNLKKYYRKNKIILLKANPEIKIAYYDENYKKTITNDSIVQIMKNMGYKRRKENIPLQLIEPKIKAILDLKKYKEQYDINNGLIFEKADKKQIKDILQLTNSDKSIEYYEALYDNFKDNIELLLIKCNYEKYLIEAKNSVEKEEYNNNKLNELLKEENNEENLLNKMESDKKLEELKKEMIFATEKLKKQKDNYIAGAIILKFNKKLYILEIGSDKDYQEMNTEINIYNKLIKEYSKNYELLDLNAIADNFDEKSEYYAYNKNKIAMKPEIIEYIGELDLIINNWKFKYYEKSNVISNEFNKKNITKIK